MSQNNVTVTPDRVGGIIRASRKTFSGGSHFGSVENGRKANPAPVSDHVLCSGPRQARG